MRVVTASCTNSSIPRPFSRIEGSSRGWASCRWPDIGLAETGRLDQFRHDLSAALIVPPNRNPERNDCAVTTLTRGANIGIDTAATTLAVTGTAPGSVDLFVFQLGDNRKVRSDDDLVFFNNPRSPEGAVMLVSSGQVRVDLHAVPAAVARIVVAVAVDGSVPGPLSSVPSLAVTASQATGAVVTAPAVGLTTERSAVLLEVYRYNGRWKVRNVSAGWEGGLAALVTEHGVTVDDAPAVPAPAAAPPTQVNLAKGKINLDKGQRVSMAKTAAITATVSWNSETDYDVYALVLFRDGHVETAAQFGTADNPYFTPVVAAGAVRHCGDIGRDAGRRGRAVEKVEIRLNDDIVCVVPVAYSAQSNGTGSFHRYKVSLAVDNGAGDVVTVDARHAQRHDNIYTCVPAIVWNRAHGVEIDAVELYSRPNSEYRPLLDHRGQLTMDAGPLNLYK